MARSQVADVLALGLSLWKKAAQYAQENNLNALTGKLNFRMGTATWQHPSVRVFWISHNTQISNEREACGRLNYC